MKPFCVALTEAIEHAGNAVRAHWHEQEPIRTPVPQPLPRQRTPELCEGLIKLLDVFLSPERGPRSITLASPIEKKMAQALIERDGAWGLRFVFLRGMDYEVCREFAKVALASPSSGAAVFPHAKIGPYELDFLLLFKNSEGTLLSMAVECDGHEFHEKTKQQAAHDKRRDRFIALHSIAMLRFTGAEIFYDAPRCAEEVQRAMMFIQVGPRDRVWLGYLSQAQADRIQAAEDEEAERQRCLEEEEREEQRKRVIKDEIMSGTYEGYYS